MNTQFVVACVAGALLGSAAMLAQAAPNFDGTAPNKCVGDGDSNPTWDTVNHHPEIPWCCYVTSENGDVTKEKVRYSGATVVVGTTANQQCKLAPP